MDREGPTKGGLRRVGPYRIETPLGAGGMGSVWRAWDERLKRPVAIKQIRVDSKVSHARQRFRREAQMAARLNHPAIVHVYDLVEGEEGDWLVMELVEGETLRNLLTEKGALLPPVAIRLGREIAQGLAVAHGLGILHRDLKASNVMVTPRSGAKILDFGIAKELLREAHPEEDFTGSAPGLLLGTCYAMSPEQVLGHRLDTRSDLFSLGSLLYEALTGTHPFQGDSSAATLGRIVGFQPAPLRAIRPEVPEGLADLITRLLEKDPARRPESAAVVVTELTELAAADRTPEGTVRRGPAEESTLVAVPAAAPAAETRRPGSGSKSRRKIGDHRLVTVVCCGLVAVDPASNDVSFLDIETLSEVMAELQAKAAEVGSRRSGWPGSALSHLLWLYFGYPQAGEDDVRHAVEAASELAAWAAEAWDPRRERGEHRLGLRIAVHTGPAMVATAPGRDESLQLGATLDLVTALQNAAPLGRVVVSPSSRQWLARSFSLSPLPPVHLPGSETPVTPYQVLGVSEPGEESGEVSPLLGRERELALLLDRFQLSRSAGGQVVLVSGEPGIGKSRLVRALRDRLQVERATQLVAYGSPALESSPLAPIVDLLERMLFSAKVAAIAPRLARLEEFLGRHELASLQALPLLASLLALPLEGRFPALTLSPDEQRRKTFEVLIELFGQIAEREPLVLIVEDLHWIDPSTLELLGLFLAEIAGLPLLLVLTFRPELQAPWGYRPQVTQISLNRLADGEAAGLIDHVARGRDLPAEARAQILARTDGVPLFLEELTRTVVESSWTWTHGEIPSTLAGSLAARLDRLGNAKEVAQVASVLGRTFSLDLLASIAPFERETVEQGLLALLTAGLVYRRGVATNARYFFKHALVQDFAYASLLGRDRQELHRRAARLFEARLAAEPGNLEVIARHYTDGQELQKAIEYWLLAGQQSLSRFANQEAIQHFERGLALLSSLPTGRDRDRCELEIQSGLALAFTVTRGTASPEVAAAHNHAFAAAERLGEIPLQLDMGLWSYYFTHGELNRSLSVAERMLGNAKGSAEREPQIFGLVALAITSAHLGDLKTAKNVFERLWSICPPESEEVIPHFFDPMVSALGNWGGVLLILGYPQKGMQLSAEAVRLAQRWSTPHSLSIGLIIHVFNALCVRDNAVVEASARHLEALLEDHADAWWREQCELYLLLVSLQEEPRSQAEVKDTVASAGSIVRSLQERVGQRILCNRYLALIAEACVEHGMLEEGQGYLEEACILTRETEERLWEEDLYRLRGVLLLKEGADALAEQAFQTAIATAQGCGAKLAELRAAVHLCRLWQRQGRSTEAHALLSGLYSSFTEGWAFRDLVEAAELLATLTPS